MRVCVCVCKQASRTAILDIIDFILDETLNNTNNTTIPPHSTDLQQHTNTYDNNRPTGPALFTLVMRPWLDELLLALKVIITTAWEGGADSTTAAAAAGLSAAALKRAAAGRRRGGGQRAHRELGILERLAGAVGSASTARLLADALAALTTGAVSGTAARRGPKAKLDEVGCNTLTM